MSPQHFVGKRYVVDACWSSHCLPSTSPWYTLVPQKNTESPGLISADMLLTRLTPGIIDNDENTKPRCLTRTVGYSWNSIQQLHISQLGYLQNSEKIWENQLKKYQFPIFQRWHQPQKKDLARWQRPQGHGPCLPGCQTAQNRNIAMNKNRKRNILNYDYGTINYINYIYIYVYSTNQKTKSSWTNQKKNSTEPNHRIIMVPWIGFANLS